MRSIQAIRWLSLALLLGLITASCNFPGSSPTADLEVIVAQTQTAIAVNQYLTATTPSEIPPSSTVPLISPQAPPSATVPAPVVTNPAETQPIAPSPTILTTNCTNKAKFEGETIPDNTVFAPGQEFMKTWTMQNVGTCSWNHEYALVFDNGEQMSGTSPSPIGEDVQPGDTIQIYLPQKAPITAGDYQGYWKLRSTTGQEFGLGENADVAFWVKIKVAEDGAGAGTQTPTGAQPNLGAPTWVESFDDKSSPFFLGTDSGIDFDIDNGRLTMTALEPTGDQWRVAQPGYWDNFFIQASFSTGNACSGKDGYGLLLRAPDQPDGNIDTGMVFSFSCDGKYRVYRMDYGNFNSIQNWTAHSAIKSGANQANLMGISAIGNEFQFYSNGVLIYEFTDNAYPAGLFGLVIRSEITSNFQAIVDEIAIWRIN